MIATIFRFLTTGIAWFGAVVLFVLCPAIGSISSILAVLLALLLAPIALFPGSGRKLLAQPAMLVFPAIFFSLVISFAITQRVPGDILFGANFFAFLMAPVVYLLADRRPGVRTIAIIAGLMVAGTIVGALTGSYDVFIQHKARAIGWASGGNLMARTVVPIGFMAVAGIFALKSRWRWLFLLGPVISLYALYLTGTRGVFVAIPILGLLMVWALMREAQVRRLWYVAGLAVVVVAVVLLGVVSTRFISVGAIVEQLTLNPATVADEATSERMYMLVAGWVTFLKSPLIGFGWANFHDAALPYVIYFFHNDFLDAAVAAGVVGIVGWAAAIAAPLIGIFYVPRDRFSNLRLYCALLLSISFFIFGLSDMEYGYDLPTTLHAFLTALVLGAFREAKAKPA